jgi:hypothetical protein
VERPHQLAAAALEGCDLGDCVVVGRPSGRLEVDDREGRLEEGRPEILEAALQLLHLDARG